MNKEVMNLKDTTDLEADFDTGLIRKRLRTLMKIILTPRERKILELHFGLRNDIPQPISEIAKKYEIPKERIRQIEAKGLEKIERFFDHKLSKNCNKYQKEKDNIPSINNIL